MDVLLSNAVSRPEREWLRGFPAILWEPRVLGVPALGYELFGSRKVSVAVCHGVGPDIECGLYNVSWRCGENGQ